MILPGMHLTPRERECMEWAARGKTSKGIANVIGIAERTVNFYLRVAMEKLDATNRTHAVALAIAQGRITP